MLDSDGLPTPIRHYAMVTIILGISLSVLDATIVNLALPGIARDMHVSAAHAIWVINAYQVAILALLLPLAMLGDIVGYRRVYLCGVALFTLASVGCALSSGLLELTTARALQGLGASGIMAVNSAMVRRIYPSSLLGRGIAINSVVVATGSVAGPSIAAAILSVANWPWLFIVNLPVGLVVLALGSRVLPKNAAPPPVGMKLRPLDVALNALMFALVFFGADSLGVSGGSASRADWGIALALFAAGLIIGVIYVRRQLSLDVPMLPLDLMRMPIFALSMCTSIGAFAAQTLSYISLPFLLLEVYGRSHLQAGLLITAWPVGVVATAPVAGRLIGRYPDGLLAGIGLALLSAGLVLLALLPAHPLNGDIAWRMMLCGVGFGLFQSPNNHAIVTSAPMHRAGGASGMLGTARLTGQTLGAVLLATIFSLTRGHSEKGPTIALAIAAGFAAVASAFSTLRVRTLAPA
jgi:DHA2 family multidrug resistance protein-like MFS transporter